MVYVRGTPTLQARVVVMAGVGLFGLLMLGHWLGWWGLSADGDVVTSMIVQLVFLALGVLIIARASSNRVGWVFVGVSFSILLSGLAGGLAGRGLLVFDAVGGAFWLSWFMAIGLLLLWFPTGRVPTSHWLRLQWAVLGLLVLTFGLYVFAEELCASYVEGRGCVAYVPNPIGIRGVPNPEYGWISDPLFITAGLVVPSCLASLVVRYRRSGVTERLQLKWFLLACLVFTLCFTAVLVLDEVVADWLNALFLVSILAIPTAATVAILRYKLYEIDPIISRTVTYALVVAVLGLVVAAAATITGTRFQEPWLVAGTTLAVAALFNPLRRRVQKVVDRRFNRSRYDAELVAERFADALKDEIDPDDVVDDWVGVVEETMQPEAACVWVRDSGVRG